MESSLQYILIVTFGGKPNIWTESDLEEMYRHLVDAKRSCSTFHILSARRCVISASGTVEYSEIRIDFDANGLWIDDKYGSLIDHYAVPPKKKRRWKIIRSETWTNDTEAGADSEEEAISIIDNMVRSGEFDVLDGWCSDVQYEVYEIKE